MADSTSQQKDQTFADMQREVAFEARQEKALALILDQRVMQPVVVVARDDHRVLYLNRRAKKYFGIEKETTLVRRALDFWRYPEQRDLFLKDLDEFGKVIDFETELLTRNGEVRHVLVSAREVEFVGQVALCSILTDITQRKKMEQELQEKEAKFQEMYTMMRLMADTMPDLLWAKDLENRYLFANPAIRRKLLRCSVDESVAGRDDLFFAERQRALGEEHTFGENCINSDEVIKESRQSGRFLEEGKVCGERLVLDVHKAPLFNATGELIGTVGAGRDVTRDMAIHHELEKSEKLFRIFAENVRDVLWITDADFCPTYISPAIESLAGYSQEEFLSLPVENHMTPKYKKKFKALRRRITGQSFHLSEFSSRFLEFECFKKDGSVFWVELMVSLIRDLDGGVKGFAGVIRDSTRRVRAEQQLSRSREEALAASQTKSEFLANMSHEIRTPLNGVLGILQLLRGTPLDTKQQMYVETAISSGKSLLTIISDILDFSKIEAGKIVLEKSPCDLRELIHSVISSFHSMVDHSMVTVGFRVEDGVPDSIFTDGSRLKQILFNLVGNSVKFTQVGEIAVRVAVHKWENKMPIELLFAVHDTGIGIPEDVAPRLFEPFVQKDGSFRRRHGGTGLGLSIVKKLVACMGGTVALSSSLGRGTVVSVYLPTEVSHCSHLDEDWEKESGWELPPMRVLVVEDESINAMVIKAMLERLEISVAHAENGRKALRLLEKEQFDCILMDIQMPELDGVEATRIIRDGHMGGGQEQIPVIALTAHATEDDRQKCYEVGMNGYLTKPVEFFKLVEVLSTVAQTIMQN